ncbi:MAG: hypothetical protein OHK0029_05730 [Armatimonadaceae bacterium]
MTRPTTRTITRSVRSRFASVALFAVSSVLLPLLAGCGGAGNPNTQGSGLNSGLGGRASTDPNSPLPDGNRRAEGQVGKVGVFLSATGKSSFDHVWATVQKVELIDVMEKPVTVYESTDGFTVDVRRLEQEGKRALLTVAPLPAGKSYIRARVTFDRTLPVFEPGSNVAKMLPFSDSVARDEQERPLLSFPLDRPRDLGDGTGNLLIEFPLDKWTVAEDRIVPALKEGGADLADLSRQETGVFTGTVQDVSTNAEGATFSLTTGENQSLTVQTSHGTIFHNAGPVPSPTLVTGKKVTVRGVLAPDTKRVMATDIMVAGDGKETAVSVVLGEVASADAATGTVALKMRQVDGMVPTLNAITVLVAPDAVFRSPGGLLLKNDDFYKSIGKPGTLVRFAGTFEPVSGTFQAVRAKVESEKFQQAHEAEVLGMAGSVKPEDRSFVLAEATEWQGIALKEGKSSVPIVATAATAYQDDKGGFLATSTFYETAAKGENPVRVLGIYANGKLTATRVVLMPPVPKKEVAKASDEAAESKPGESKAEETSNKSAESEPKAVKPEPAENPQTAPTEPVAPKSP